MAAGHPRGGPPALRPAAGREVKALEAEGVRTVVFAPGAAEQEVMGNDMLSRERLPEIIQQAFLAAGAHAAEPGVADLIRLAADR